LCYNGITIKFSDPKNPSNKWDSPFKAGYSIDTPSTTFIKPIMLNITLADLQPVFMPCKLNHWIQQPEKPQKQMALTFQSWILHLQDPILTCLLVK
jgi:hypothetical protein